MPEDWDCSVAGLRSLLARLQQSHQPGHRQAAVVLGQRAEVALRAAGIPASRRQLCEAACR
jgi:hypothetical protein